MKHRLVALVVGTLLVLTIVGPAAAHVDAGRNTWFNTITSVYGSCPGSFATWKGSTGRVLVLNKACPTSDASTSSDATIKVRPRCAGDNQNLSCYFSAGGLTALGFDHKISTYCGAGSPGWDVEAPDGNVWRFGCAYGIHTPLSGRPGWERITFTAADAVQLGGSATFAFDGSIKPFFMQVLQDEMGCTILDRLLINAVKIKHGPAGSAAHC